MASHCQRESFKDGARILRRIVQICLHPDTSILQADQFPTKDKNSVPIMKRDVEAVVWNLAQSPREDNVAPEVVTNGD